MRLWIGNPDMPAFALDSSTSAGSAMMRVKEPCDRVDLAQTAGCARAYDVLMSRQSSPEEH
jgi:hypothetical protein